METFMWNPWHGCHKCSEGCRNCWVFQQDALRDIDTNVIRKSKSSFDLPCKMDRYRNYKIPDGSKVNVCFTSDFFIEEADAWRDEAWWIIKSRPNILFQLLTKRIHRVADSLPKDWGNGYPNVILGVSCENQEACNLRVPVLKELPFIHKDIFCAPLISDIDFGELLSGIDAVNIGGENWKGARPCHYEWVLHIRDQCIKTDTNFTFWSTGSNFYMNSKHYTIWKSSLQKEQATKANIDYVSSIYYGGI